MSEAFIYEHTVESTDKPEETSNLTTVPQWEKAYVIIGTIGHADALYINLVKPYTEGESSVKYRGIFMNDEMSFKNHTFNKNDSDLS